MKEGSPNFYVTGEGRRHPAEDLYGYADSLIKARLSAAYRLGCNLLPVRRRETVVDVGSGHGHGVVTINEELSPSLVISGDRDYSYVRAQNTVLSKQYAPYWFVQLKVPDLPLPTGSIDTIFLMHVLEHLKKPEETLADIRKALQPQGELVVATPWIENLVGKNPQDEHVYGTKELGKVMHDAGFETTTFYVTADSYAYAVHSRKRRLARIPFARELRRALPLQLTERFLRRGILEQPLSPDNFSISAEPNSKAIDLLVIASPKSTKHKPINNI